MAANKARIPLAKMAVEETGRGVLEDKVIKNHYAAEYIYNAYKDTKTCGVIERDDAYGITKIAEPIGIVGAVIPTTNPTSTAIFKCLISLKTRNAIIISRTRLPPSAPSPPPSSCSTPPSRPALPRASSAGWTSPPSTSPTRSWPTSTSSWPPVAPAWSRPPTPPASPPWASVPATPRHHRRYRRHQALGQLHHPLQDLRQRHDLRLRAVRDRPRVRV